MATADPLSRLARQENQLDNLDLPLMLEMLLKELPSTVRNALNIRVNAEKDTIVATRIVQRWRKPPTRSATLSDQFQTRLIS
jgi:hypothetical protein